MPQLRFREQLRRLEQRQTHDAGVAAVDVRDPCRSGALNRIRTGLAERFAAVDITGDLRLAQRGKTHVRDVRHQGLFAVTAAAPAQRDRRDHAVAAARQQAQRGHGIGCVHRFAQNATAECDRGVRTEDRCRWQAARTQANAGGVQLGAGDAFNVVQRQFTGDGGFQRFGVFIGRGQQQLMERRVVRATGAGAGFAMRGR